MVYNFGAAILRAIGDTRRPLYYLLIAGDTGYLTDKRDNSIYEDYCDDFLKFCRDNWKQTILIPGNHEYYDGFPFYKKNEFIELSEHVSFAKEISIFSNCSESTFTLFLNSPLKRPIFARAF